MRTSMSSFATFLNGTYFDGTTYKGERLLAGFAYYLGGGAQGDGDRIGTSYLQISQLGELLATIL